MNHLQQVNKVKIYNDIRRPMCLGGYIKCCTHLWSVCWRPSLRPSRAADFLQTGKR